MANIQFTDFATSVLAVGIGPADVTLTVTGGQGARFPALTGAQYFYATLENAALVREIVKVTARSTDTFTVVRAQGGTAATSWSAGDSIALRLNSLALKAVLDVEDNATTAAATAVAAQSSASASAATATAQAGIATTQANNATVSAATATAQAGIATTQASSAAASAGDASASASAAASLYDQFDDRYLGAKVSDPTVDNDGNALLTGAAYWNSSSGELRFWSGSAWLTANLVPGGYLGLGGGTLTGDLNFSGNGRRITGDFSNATVADRLMFQTSTVNGGSVVGFSPNGTATSAHLRVYGNSDPTNASYLGIRSNGLADTRLEASFEGTGTYLPMTFYTGGSERVKLDTSGNLGIGVTPSAWAGNSKTLTVSNAVTGRRNNGASIFGHNFYESVADTFTYTQTGVAARMEIPTTGGFTWNTAASGTAGNTITWTQSLTLDNSGRLALGTTPSAWAATHLGFDISTYGSVNGTTSNTGLYYNTYYNGANWVAKNTTTAAMYLVGAGTHTWYGMASVSAGSNQTPVQTLALDTAGNLTATANVTAYSDERLKTNWQDFDADILNQLANVKVGVYDRTDLDVTQVGVSAQSLQAVLPAAVNTGEDGMLSVAYGNAALAMCVMLARKVEQLEARIKELEA